MNHYDSRKGGSAISAPKFTLTIGTVIAVVAALLFALSACSSSDVAGESSAPASASGGINASSPEDEGTLASINVFLYRSDTPRSQPELINAYSERSDVDALAAWLKTAGPPEAFPDDKKVLHIQVITYYYENAGRTVRSDGYMYVTFEGGTGYSKLAKPPAYIKDTYPYEAEFDNPFILMDMGKDGWRKMGDTNRLA